MGMFNYVKVKASCPECRAKLRGWQSKYMTHAGHEIARTLENIEITGEISGEIHTMCDTCGAWYDWSVKDGQIVREKHPSRIGKEPWEA